MASLAGKADATLVTAATRASLANVPGDYSKQWEAATKARTTLFEGLDTISADFKKNKAAAVKEVDALKNKIYQYGATIENNYTYDIFQGSVDELLNEAKEKNYFKNDPRGRAEFERKLNQKLQPYTSSQKSMASLVEAWDSDTAWKTKLKGDELGLFKNILLYADNAGDYNAGQYDQAATEVMANNTGAETDVTLEQMWEQTAGADAKEGTVIKYLDPVSGEFTYVTKVGENIVSKKSSDLAKSVPQRDKDGQEQFGDYINTFEDNAAKSKTAYGDTDSKNTKNDLRSFIDERLKVNEWALQDLMSQTHGPQEMSFEDAIRKGHTSVSMDIIQELENMSASDKEKFGYIGDDNDVFGSEDFATPDNYNAMVDYILESEESLDFRKELFVDYMDETVFKPLHDHEASKKLGYDVTDALGEFKQRKITTKYGDFTGQDLVHDAEGIKRMQAGELEEGEYHESVVSGNRYRYDKDNDQWYIQQPEFDGDEFTGWGTEEEKSLKEVQQDMGHGNYLKELGGIYRTSAVGADVEVTDDDIDVIPTEDETETETEPKNTAAATIGTSTKQGVVVQDAQKRLLQQVGAKQERDRGNLTKATFVNYTGDSIFEAEKALAKAKENGFEDASIKYFKDGKEINKENYNKLKDKSKVTFKTQIAAGEYNEFFDGGQLKVDETETDTEVQTTIKPYEFTFETEKDKGKVTIPLDPNKTVVSTSMIKDRYTGQGTRTWKEKGEKYEGDFKDGKRHGQGTYTWKNGAKYEGEWKDGEKHGQGTATFKNGSKYVGEWKDGEIFTGTFTWDNGDEFVGEWRDNKMFTGTYTDDDGTVTTYKEGKEVDPGVTTETVTEEETTVYGPDNPDPMFGSSNTDGTQMMSSSGDWIDVGSKAYYKDLGIKSKKGKDFVNGEGVMKKVNEIANNHGFNVRELLNVIQKESNFDPAAVNKKSGATGLIQFFADKGKDYKTIGGTQYKIADIKKMPIVEQLDLINKYFEENHKYGQHPYITIAYPKAHNMKLDDIIATSDSVIAKQNPVWVNDNGNVTKRSIIEYAEGA